MTFSDLAHPAQTTFTWHDDETDLDFRLHEGHLECRDLTLSDLDPVRYPVAEWEPVGETVSLPIGNLLRHLWGLSQPPPQPPN